MMLSEMAIMSYLGVYQLLSGIVSIGGICTLSRMKGISNEINSMMKRKHLSCGASKAVLFYESIINSMAYWREASPEVI